MNTQENMQQNPAFEEQRKPIINPNEPYHFTSEETRVLRECNRESFYQRSLPMGTFLGLGTFYAVKSGYLKASARWGATPKVMAAVFVGYFMGKFSYQKKCAEKMMQLPNSPLGEMLRKRRQQAGGSFTESFGLEASVMPSLPLPSTSESYDAYAEHGPRSMDLDITRPMQDNLDSSIPRGNDAFLDEEPLPESKHNTTYEELRRQNRDDYEKKRNTRILPGVEEPPNVIRAPRTISPPTSSTFGEKNQYGDIMER